MKKMTLLSLLFIVFGFNINRASDVLGSSSLLGGAQSTISNVISNKFLRFAGVVACDAALTYAAYMASLISHEYGHALTAWLFNRQAHVTINGKEDPAKPKKKYVFFDSSRKVSFPKMSLNLIPTDNNYCLNYGGQSNYKQDALITLAGPLAGMAAGYLSSYLLPNKLFFKVVSGLLVCFDVTQLIPVGNNDGSRILENVGIPKRFIPKTFFEGCSESSFALMAATLVYSSLGQVVHRAAQQGVIEL